MDGGGGQVVIMLASYAYMIRIRKLETSTVFIA